MLVDNIVMEPKSKSEWFKLDKPYGEPHENYRENEYWIERVVKENGDIVWFGLGTNWLKEPNKEWTELGTDYSVEPLKPGGNVYPEGRSKFFPCEEPIYETLYRKLNKSN
jgi:hypothetical protein